MSNDRAGIWGVAPPPPASGMARFVAPASSTGATLRSRLTSGLLSMCLVGVCVGAAATAVPPRAAAYAAVGSAPGAAASGLPDGRVYEEVSPANKNGNYVASGGLPATGLHGYAAASGDGNALVFLGSGAMGSAVASTLGPYVARRSSSGWSTSSAISPQRGPFIVGDPNLLVPSAGFSSFVFGSRASYATEQPLGPKKSVNLYLTDNPEVAPAWLGKPTVANPIPLPGENTFHLDYIVAGGTPSLSTVYFSYSGTLIAEDESRAPNVGEGTGESGDPWGFYEWTKGELHAAGVLPDGTLSPFGAVPAAVAGDEHNSADWQAGDFNNEVSADGSRAFFVSPDPIAATVSTPPELYVRETLPDGSKRTRLISENQVPGHLGAPAPDGASSVADALIQQGEPVDSTDVYASADGSHAFFESVDQLTAQAPEGTSVKEYDFNLETGALTYLPGVAGPIVAASHDGSVMLFKNREELELWRTGASGGEVTPVAQLPGALSIGQPYAGEVGGTVLTGVEARASSDGSVFVFDTNAPIPGFANDASGYGEVYRYDVAANALTCLSCAPVGVIPSGNAYISYDNIGGNNSKPRSTVDTRAISSDGSRVFFDTPDPLVPQDSNGRRDVYEWSDGGVSLISSGSSPEDSFYLDNSESGNDVFFNTADGLVAGDADGAYDAYDARVPQPGDTPPPSAVPCEGDVCQGAPSVPSLLDVPPSVTFDGAGNVAPPKAKPPGHVSLTRAQKLAKALKMCRTKNKHKTKRFLCEKRARRTYGRSK